MNGFQMIVEMTLCAEIFLTVSDKMVNYLHAMCKNLSKKKIITCTYVNVYKRKELIYL